MYEKVYWQKIALVQDIASTVLCAYLWQWVHKICLDELLGQLVDIFGSSNTYRISYAML